MSAPQPRQRREKARLSDHEVELMRRLHEQGIGYRNLAKIFDVHRATVQFICTYRRR